MRAGDLDGSVDHVSGFAEVSEVVVEVRECGPEGRPDAVQEILPIAEEWALRSCRASSRTESQLRRLSPLALGVRDVFLVVHPDLARVARMRAVMDFIVEMFTRDPRMWDGTRAI
jgi:hypothetical protein